VFKINNESFSALIANKIFHVTVVLLIYFCNQFVASEIRHSRRHCSVCDEGKILILKVCIWRGTQQRGWQTNFLRKAGQSMVLISCSKSCGTQAQLRGGQAAADRAVPAPKKTLSFFFRSSRVSDFVLLTVEWSDRDHLFVPKENKSVAYCCNFSSRSLACFMQAAQFASVSSCARHLLKHLRCKSLQIIWNRDDRWIPVSNDISRTGLWVCGLCSWLKTKSLTVSTFSSLRA